MIIPFDGESMTEILGYATGLFDDYKPVFFIIFGISLGFWILETLVNPIKK